MEQLLLSGNKIVEMNLKYSFSYIKIRRILVHSLSQIPSKDWINSLIAFNILFKYSDNRSTEKTIEFSLLPYMSPYQTQPVFSFEDLEIPEENVKNITSLSNHFTHLSISIKYIHEQIHDAKLVILFDASPGVEITKNDEVIF